MQQTINRILAWVLALALTAGMLPGFTFRVYADSGEESIVETEETQETQTDSEKETKEESQEEQEADGQKQLLPPEETESTNLETSEDEEENAASTETISQFVPVSSGTMEPAYDNAEDGLWAVLYGGGGISAYSLEHAYNGLNDLEKALYHQLVTAVSNVANGKSTSASVEDIAIAPEIAQKKWSAAELGVDSVVKNNQINPAAQRALSEKIQECSEVDFLKAWMAAEADSPLEFFWVYTCSYYQRIHYSATYDYSKREYLLSGSCLLTIEAIAVEEYQGADENHVNPAEISRVTTAKNKVSQIVAANAGLSDDKKMAAYRDAICQLVSYNDDVPEKKFPYDYGNPWQLIWVFDGDPTTNVVCEGYSKAFQYLCEMSSFSTVAYVYSVTGQMVAPTNQGPHMWNLVKYQNGDLRLVDVTNYDSGNNHLFLAKPTSGSMEAGYAFDYIRYYYDDSTLQLFGEDELNFSQSQVHTHNYTFTVTTAPTTAASGTLTGKCTGCDSTTTVTLPALDTVNYTYSVTKQPGCTTSGTGHYVWKVTKYGSFSFDATLYAKGHTIVTDQKVDATCTVAGKTEGKHCSVCNTVTVAQQPISATGHSFTYAVTTAPTTADAGTLTGTCRRCQGTTTVTLPKLDSTNYTYSVTKQPNCTAAGTGHYVWKVTKYGSFSFDTTLHAKGHTEVTDQKVDATCTVAGKTEGKHCSVCKAVLVAQNPIPATGHSYSYKVTKAPTTDATGTLTGTCAKCQGTTTVTLPKLDTTSYTYSVTKQPTTAAAGEGTYTWKNTQYGNVGISVTLPKLTELKITAQPQNQEVEMGKVATFTVVAEGEGLTYQWQYRGATETKWTTSAMTGANTASLSIQLNTARIGRVFRCVVKDAAGNTVTTNEVVLSEKKTAELKITAQPQDQEVEMGKVATFTVAAEGKGLSYQWQYRDASATKWTTSTMSGAITPTIKVQLNTARVGRSFRCVIQDASGKTVTSNEAVLREEKGTELKITAQPQDQEVEMGQVASFTVTAEGKGLSYKWQYRDANATKWTTSTMQGATTPTIKVQLNTARVGRSFRCVIQDASGKTVTSNEAVLRAK